MKVSLGKRTLGTSQGIKHHSSLLNYVSDSHKGLRPRANLFKRSGLGVFMTIGNLRTSDEGKFGANYRSIGPLTGSNYRFYHGRCPRPANLHSLAVSSLCAGLKAASQPDLYSISRKGVLRARVISEDG